MVIPEIASSVTLFSRESGYLIRCPLLLRCTRRSLGERKLRSPHRRRASAPAARAGAGLYLAFIKDRVWRMYGAPRSSAQWGYARPWFSELRKDSRLPWMRTGKFKPGTRPGGIYLPDRKKFPAAKPPIANAVIAARRSRTGGCAQG